MPRHCASNNNLIIIRCQPNKRVSRALCVWPAHLTVCQMPPAVCAAPLPPRYYDYYYIKLQHHHSRSLHIEGSDMMHKCRVHSIAFLCSTPSQVQFQLHHITTITLLYTTCNHRLKSHFFLKKRKRKEKKGMQWCRCLAHCVG